MELRSVYYAIPYAIVFIILFIFYLLEKKVIIRCDLKRNQVVLNRVRILALIVLVFFIGLRGHVYTDCIQYYYLFDGMPLIWNLHLEDFNMEPGFIIYTSLFKTIIPNYFCWVFFNSLFYLIILYLFIKKSTPSVVLGFLAFLAYQGLYIDINLYRNAMAISFFMISIPYIQNKRFLPFLILNVIGATFHVAALLYIPLYFVIDKKWSNSVLWGFFIIANICFFFQLHPTTILIGEFSSGASEYIAYKANKYANYSETYGLSFGYFEKTIVTCLIIILYNKLSNKKSINYVYCNCAILFYFITFLFSDIAILTERLSYLFIFSLWVILPEIFYISFQNKKIVTTGILLLLFMRLVVSNMTAMCYYDNLLWGIMDIEQRVMINERFI